MYKREKAKCEATLNIQRFNFELNFCKEIRITRENIKLIKTNDYYCVLFNDIYVYDAIANVFPELILEYGNTSDIKINNYTYRKIKYYVKLYILPELKVRILEEVFCEWQED